MSRTPAWSAFYIFFFSIDTATTEIYTLSLHDALPIFLPARRRIAAGRSQERCSTLPTTSHVLCRSAGSAWHKTRSEEHTSELQSRGHLVCRLLLEKKKKKRSTLHNKNI